MGSVSLSPRRNNDDWRDIVCYGVHDESFVSALDDSVLDDCDSSTIRSSVLDDGSSSLMSSSSSTYFVDDDVTSSAPSVVSVSSAENRKKKKKHEELKKRKKDKKKAAEEISYSVGYRDDVGKRDGETEKKKKEKKKRPKLSKQKKRKTITNIGSSGGEMDDYPHDVSVGRKSNNSQGKIGEEKDDEHIGNDVQQEGTENCPVAAGTATAGAAFDSSNNNDDDEEQAVSRRRRRLSAYSVFGQRMLASSTCFVD